MNRQTSAARRKPALLLAAAALLSLALSLPSARPASAIIGCGIGCFSGARVTYYTDATYKKVLCFYDCNEDTCNGETSRYERVFHTCCCE